MGNAPDHELIETLLRKQGAWEKFVHRYSDLVYSFCSSVFSPPELEAEYLNNFRHLKADNFSVLRAFDGRGHFSTYLHPKLREHFARRIPALYNLRFCWSKKRHLPLSSATITATRIRTSAPPRCCLVISRNFLNQLLSATGRTVLL
jgi:hypothetical protein